MYKFKYENGDGSRLEGEWSTFVYKWLLNLRLQDFRKIGEHNRNFVLQTNELPFDGENIKDPPCFFKIYMLVDERSDICICVKYIADESKLPGKSAEGNRYADSFLEVALKNIEWGLYCNNDRETIVHQADPFLPINFGDIPFELARRMKATGEFDKGKARWWYTTLVLSGGWQATGLNFTFRYTITKWSAAPQTNIRKDKTKKANSMPHTEVNLVAPTKHLKITTDTGECSANTPNNMEKLFRNRIDGDVLIFSAKRQSGHKAHKFVLAVQSAVFAEIFERTQSSSLAEIDLESAKPVVVAEFIKFLYIGKADFNSFSSELHPLSVKYGVKKLRKLCERQMTTIQSPLGPPELGEPVKSQNSDPVTTFLSQMWGKIEIV